MPFKYHPVIYGLIHALVDTTTVGILFGSMLILPAEPKTRFYLILLYNALAFGSQPIFGLAADFLKRPRAVSVAGLLLAGAALFFFRIHTVPAVILAGIGNALFHVGGGIITLFATPGKALGPGVFVAPGALGLAAGSLLGKSGHFTPWLWGLLMVLSVVVIICLPAPVPPLRGEDPAPRKGFSELAVLLFMFSIFIRYVIGSTAGFFLEKGMVTLMILATAACCGKALGGLLADKLGWLRTPVTALLISIPLLTIRGGGLPAVAAGVLLFQMTMPVTLTAAAGCLPRFPGTAFGLNCLALFGGVLVCMDRTKFLFYNPLLQGGLILFAAVVLAGGILLYRHRLVKEPPQNHSR